MTKIGSVEHDDLVVMEKLHVHWGYANAWLQEIPLTLVGEG